MPSTTKEVVPWENSFWNPSRNTWCKRKNQKQSEHSNLV